MANKKQKYIMSLPESVEKEIWFNLKKQGKIRVVGLGIFEIKQVKAITRYSPFSNKVITNKPYKKISFRPYKPLIEFIDNE